MRNRDCSFYYWIPAIVWMGLILVGGSPYGFLIGNKVRHFTYISQVLKGVFHIGEFAILTVLVLIPLHKRKFNFGSIITWAIIMGSGVALLSECSQFLFSSYQLFEWIDLGMNEVGIGVVLLFYTRKSRIRGLKD